MPSPQTTTQIRWSNISTCMGIALNSLEILANRNTPFLEAIANTTRSLLEFVQVYLHARFVMTVSQSVFKMVKQNKETCIQLMEQTYELLNAIVLVHMKLETGDLPPIVSRHIGRFAEQVLSKTPIHLIVTTSFRTLHKIHTFIETQQKGGKVKKFFRHGELNALLKDCKAGLEQGFNFFEIHKVNFMTDIVKMRQDAEQKHKEILDMVAGLPDMTSSDRASTISKMYSGSYTSGGTQNVSSSNSISMLPSVPKIFHGRGSELSDMIELFSQGPPRIAILGAGGMGKTSLARAVLHHAEVSAQYTQHRYFVACDSATSRVELAALIGAHLGLKPSKDLTQAVVKFLVTASCSLLILDNLETVWEPTELRGDVEEFLSLLTDIKDLALIITMRGAERPAKVKWSHPFLPLLQPLNHHAAQQTFIDIAEDHHNPEDIDRVLSLTDNMPLAINLIAHLVDVEGCSSVLSRWEAERTSVISEGYDKKSNLDVSISLSLSSPRIKAAPQAQELLSLLSMLPDGLSDVEILQSKLPIEDIWNCKTTLIRTALAYLDDKKQLKALVPIREYMQKIHPPRKGLVKPLFTHFYELLELHKDFSGTEMNSATVRQISSNLANIQILLRNGLQKDHPDITENVFGALYLNLFTRITGRGSISLLDQLHKILPQPCDHRLEVYFISELFVSYTEIPIFDPETLVAQALEHFEHFEDSDLKCKFYITAGAYYVTTSSSTALKFCHLAIALASSSGNTKRHSQALYQLATHHWQLGNYVPARLHACEAQRLARISADLYKEAQALYVQAMVWTQHGDYKQSISLCHRARELLVLCGMSNGGMDHSIMNHQAEIHSVKSEYHEAHKIQTQILQDCPLHMDSDDHAFALMNLAEIGLSMTAPKEEVQQDIRVARKIFLPMEHIQELTMCDTIMADLYLREGDILAAEALFKQCLAALSHSKIKSFCLERLGNASRWGAIGPMSSWATVYLAHSLKFKERLGIHKALQFLGDIFLAQRDEDTAASLFTVALEGFTYMDVHHSRAECMLRLGDIAKEHDDLPKAVEFWDAARPLFKRSSQTKWMQDIDKRLVCIGKNVLEQHRRNLACLAEINAPTGTVEDTEEDPSDIEDLQEDQGGVQLAVMA
ncbi:hypothetical protein DFH08DRAFT_1011405 [Mycena albidolilacea]|uniref:Novel STAND NTPase 1 domain-containing protein n=1 Tax=Mycena albidolilacea TaxID=1033008 RepID=A0AAD6ZWB4_9AGAR|nr:hypothetical protein DFH08DRAFT_1011405 [Mycena albidolilacea]